ncbi:MAG TPA: class I SAM-dependent methyltransferase [Chitinophagales bacterium]|nr:class I SAM-dependent methyltransferase [Chitinophagales bacterium]
MQIENPAFNYDKYGQQYSGYRQTDPRIAAYVYDALADAGTILNVGAGAGSYEPADKYVVAVEPSAVMRTQRIINGKTPAIIGTADALPFDDNAFDASMAMVTVHHWPDIQKGLKELRRVTKNQMLLMTFDPDALDNFWNAHYFPELIAVEKARYPSIDFILNTLGGNCEVKSIPIPFDCVDGFQEAFYGRPEAFLEKEVRKAQSAWSFLEDGMEDILVQRLSDDLASGEWDKKYGHYRTQPTFTCALKLIIAHK